jgi:hypothetical protein
MGTCSTRQVFILDIFCLKSEFDSEYSMLAFNAKNSILAETDYNERAETSFQSLAVTTNKYR